MAQYSTGFTEYTVGVTPSDFTERWHPGSTLTVEIVSGTPVLRLENSSGSDRRFWSWDPIDADPDRDNVEVCVKWRWTGGAQPVSMWPIRVRGSGTSSSETAYSAIIWPANSLRAVIHRYLNAVATSPAGDIDFVPVMDTVYRIILRVNGSSLRMTVALESDPNTLIVDLETTDTGISSAGWVGVGAFSVGTTQEWLFYGVGTDGDAAPTEPVTGGTPTDINANTEALTLTEYPAAITLDVNVGSAVEALSLTTQIAAVGLDVNINTVAEQLQITALQSDITLDANILCGVESLSLSTYQAAINDVAVVDSIDAGYGVNPYAEYPYAAETALAITYLDVLANQESLALTTYPASLSYDVDILANSEALSLTTNNATFVYNVNVNAAVEQLSLDTNQATLDYSVNILSSAESLTLTANQATIAFGVNLFAGAESLTLESYPATIGLNAVIFTEPESLSITTLPTTIGIDTNVMANAEALELAGNAAQVLFGTNVQCANESLVVTGLQASFIYDVDALPQSVSLTIDTHAAFIGIDVEVLAGTESLSVSTSQSDVDALYLSSDYGYSTGAYSEHPYADVALIGFGSPQVDPVVSLLRLETSPATIIVNDFIATLYSPIVFIADESPAIFDAVDDVPRFEVISMVEIFEAVE